MATTRSTGYVVTATVWNNVLSRLTDDGVTFSGNFNGGTIAGTTISGTTGTLSSTLAVTGVATFTATAVATSGITIGATDPGWAVGRIYRSATYGTVIGASTGSTSDFSIYNRDGGALVMAVSPNTLNVAFGNDVTVNGMLRAGTTVSSVNVLVTGSVELDSVDNGSSVGPLVKIGRNEDATYPQAGTLALLNKNGTEYYLWVDATGDLRIHTSPPSQDAGVSDTAGTVVGTQT